MVRRHPVYSFQKYKHACKNITSIQWFILWYSCLVDSCKTHSVEKCLKSVMWCSVNDGIVVEKHTRLCSIGRSVCRKWS